MGKARVVAMTKDVSLTERRKGQIEGNQYSVHDKEPLCDQLFNFESLLHLDPPRQAGSNHSKQILICILIRDESNDSLCMLMVVFMIMLIQKIHQKNLTMGSYTFRFLLMKRDILLPTIFLFAVTHLTLAPQFLLFATFLAIQGLFFTHFGVVNKISKS